MSSCHLCNGSSPSRGLLPQVKRFRKRRGLLTHGYAGLGLHPPHTRAVLVWEHISSSGLQVCVIIKGLGGWAEKFRLSPQLHIHKHCQVGTRTTCLLPRLQGEIFPISNHRLFQNGSISQNHSFSYALDSEINRCPERTTGLPLSQTT